MGEIENKYESINKKKYVKKTPVAKKIFQETWDWLYSFEVIKKHKPLKINSKQDFLRRSQETGSGIGKKQLRKAFSIHCNSERYLRNAAKGGFRYNIDFNQDEEITAEHQQNFIDALKAKREFISKAKAYERRKEEKQRQYEKRNSENQDRNKDNGSRLKFQPRKKSNSYLKIAVKKSRRG
ncbi:ProQ/FINO family protein [Vibrio aestuarianus]|uniref:ProQ/FINO family protein n=1 Tax=Vibrio aestuarianus TaxID=28171 RepID=UPI00237C9653|nr:ProQ/FINO family protein [Vibrio aestuarianus]MDE1231595.1 ProQ/FinO family protein [Vibrio aestuarianus]